MENLGAGLGDPGSDLLKLPSYKWHICESSGRRFYSQRQSGSVNVFIGADNASQVVVFICGIRLGHMIKIKLYFGI